MWTKEEIQYKLSKNEKWMIRAVEVLYDRQTEEERYAGLTLKSNLRGFNKFDSMILSEIYHRIQQNKMFKKVEILSTNDFIKCSKKLPKYWKQIEEEIKLRSSKNSVNV